MPFYHRLGSIPHKRHTQFRSARGDLYHEELMGIHGFAGIQSLLYHLRPPTAVHDVSVVRSTALEFESDGPLRHRLLNTLQLPEGGNAIDGRIPLLGNADCVISVVRPTEPMPYWYRFAHGDELHFVHEGTGVGQPREVEAAVFVSDKTLESVRDIRVRGLRNERVSSR